MENTEKESWTCCLHTKSKILIMSKEIYNFFDKLIFSSHCKQTKRVASLTDRHSVHYSGTFCKQRIRKPKGVKIIAYADDIAITVVAKTIDEVRLKAEKKHQHWQKLATNIWALSGRPYDRIRIAE